MIDGQLLRARPKASEGTSGSEEVGRVGGWMSGRRRRDGGGVKGLCARLTA